MDRFFKDVPTIVWDELDGKTLIIRVTEDDKEEDMKCKMLCGYDPIEDITYVLATELSK